MENVITNWMMNPYIFKLSSTLCRACHEKTFGKEYKYFNKYHGMIIGTLISTGTDSSYEVIE